MSVKFPKSVPTWPMAAALLVFLTILTFAHAQGVKYIIPELLQATSAHFLT